MGKRRHRTKYILNQRYRRMRRLKFAGILLGCAILIGGTLYIVLEFYGSNGFHPNTDIKLADDD